MGGWTGGRLELRIMLTQFNCNCNCLLELSLAIMHSGLLLLEEAGGQRHGGPQDDVYGDDGENSN